MVLEKLGSSLYDALRKVIKAQVVDEALVKELIKDFQRALLQADVNVALVMQLSQNIEKRALNEELPPGISRREHIVKVVYDELTKFVGEKQEDIKIQPGKQNIIMLMATGKIMPLVLFTGSFARPQQYNCAPSLTWCNLSAR